MKEYCRATIQSYHPFDDPCVLSVCRLVLCGGVCGGVDAHILEKNNILTLRQAGSIQSATSTITSCGTSPQIPRKSTHEGVNSINNLSICLFAIAFLPQTVVNKLRTDFLISTLSHAFSSSHRPPQHAVRGDERICNLTFRSRKLCRHNQIATRHAPRTSKKKASMFSAC